MIDKAIEKHVKFSTFLFIAASITSVLSWIAGDGVKGLLWLIIANQEIIKMKEKNDKNKS